MQITFCMTKYKAASLKSPCLISIAVSKAKVEKVENVPRKKVKIKTLISGSKILLSVNFQNKPHKKHATAFIIRVDQGK